jgi:DNA-3-methyladenine glycosylase II
MPDVSTHYDYPRIQRHLSRRDAVLKRLITSHGPCTLRFDNDYFGVLARSIVAQQISSKAAISISARLKKVLGRRGLTARAVLAASDESLRSAGLSAGKTRYLKDLATKTHEGELRFAEFPDMPEEEIIAQLTTVHGIGRWTAEMFLIFSLGRLDVLPVADYGLRAGVKQQYGLQELPGKSELVELGNPWRPFRSVATWYFWRSFGNVPQS